MNKPILLSILTMFCIVTCCRAGTPRLREKHMWHYVGYPPQKGTRIKRGDLYLVSAKGVKTSAFFTASKVKISGGVDIQEQARGISWVLNDSTCKMGAI